MVPRAPYRRRLFDYPRAGRSGVLRWLPSWKHLLALVLLVFSACFAVVGVAYAITPVPHRQNSAATKQANIWYWSDGSEITRTGSTNRESVALSEVPLTVQHAVLAAEDRTFYSDDGISIKGTLRALASDLTGGPVQGGSTITQQYVKNVYLTQQQTLSRKFKEALISVKLDRTTSKDEILEGYLNTSYFGRGAYGIQAASRAYYGVDVGKLTTAQGAYLAALLNAPSSYDVKNTTPKLRQDAINRWNYVLDGMVKSKWLSPADRAAIAAQGFPEPIDPQPAAGLSGMNGYLVNLAKSYLLANDVVDEQHLDNGGYRIYTTFDKAKTQALYDTVTKQLASTLDPSARSTDVGVRVGAATVEPGTGKIVAIYGGPDYTQQFVDSATRTDVQVGSTFKPFVLAAAMRDGTYNPSGGRQTVTPNTVYDGDNDVVIHYPDTGQPVLNAGTPWQPGNEDGQSYGQITLDKAMAYSVNTVYAQLAMDTGTDQVRQASIDAGLPADTPGLDSGPTISLGTATPSALDLASAYATFAANGQYTAPYPVEKLLYNGDSVSLPSHDHKQVFTPQLAANESAVLKDVVDNGTGYRAAAIGRPAAGKTGTTDSNLSAWFVGYTPQLSTAVGMFRQDPQTSAFLSMNGVGGLSRVDGGNIPTRIWATYMGQALDGLPPADFPTPDFGAAPVLPSATASPSTTPSASTTPTPTPSDTTAPSEPPTTYTPPAPTSSTPRPTRTLTSTPSTAPPESTTPQAEVQAPARTTTGTGTGTGTASP